MAATKIAETDPIAAMRARISDLLAERDQLRERMELTEAAPRPLDEALPDLDELIKVTSARFTPATGWLAQRAGQAHAVASSLCDHRSDREPVSAFSLLCWAAPDLVREGLERDLVATYDRLPAPLPSDERERRVSGLKVKITKIEREIADRWWAAMDGGLQLEPPDVHGAVLVGLEARP
jgi:hypothetical protein